ncbi:hypothetical protein SAMN04488515_0163 [Cognatiyoonia koreensis]|uniref:Uncharacterized protein n=1 Tax=Cognatiyoonia koreensis TaxID=364200 RepID=A0A1I0MQU0_9RHOB|nr:hypothetical protein [Cognatiyoonia koreensis]SEV90582.1 hypothetical protein SAMN04488515_0163 [Cognatiyoonia koreensis]
MPIRLFAVGTGAFEYRNLNIDVGEVFEMADMASLAETLPSAGRTAARAAGNEAITSNLQRGMTGIADGAIQSAFRAGCYALREAPGDLALSFSFRNEHWHQMHDTGNRQFTLTHRMMNPAWHILERIRPALESASMMNFGTLAGLAATFTNFSLHESHPGASQHRNRDRPIAYSGIRRLNVQMTC